MAVWEWPQLKEWMRSEAPVEIAAGDVRAVRDQFELSRMQDLSGLDHAVSLAFPLPIEALAGIKDHPTMLYKHAYSQLNNLMDRLALGLALRLQESGHRALAIPASQMINWEKLLAHVNHRQVAVHLGLGWYGRNNLLVHPTRGARVRLVTVLTDAEIIEPGPWSDRVGESGCGRCRRCAKVCPVDAIHDGPEDFDLTSCAARNKEHEKIQGVGQRICGVCVKVCRGPGELMG